MLHHSGARTAVKHWQQYSFQEVRGSADMSMRPRLWSLNGLATELGRDRRTMGKIFGTTAPDGKLNGHSAWLLRTALNALDEHDKPQRASVAEFANGVLSHFI